MKHSTLFPLSILLFIANILVYQPLLAQNWAVGLGSSSTDEVQSIAIDAANNSYVVGFFTGTIDLDGSGTNVLSSAGGRDIFIAQINPNGQLNWALGIGGTGDDEGNDIAVDNNGNVYVVGRFSGFVDFDPTISISLKSSLNSSDVFLAKYDVSGALVSVQTIAGTGTDAANHLALDEDDNIYIAGIFDGSLDFTPSSTNDDLSLLNNSGVFFAKYTSAGIFLWSKKLENSNALQLNDLAVDALGNLYLVGAFNANTDFNPSSNTNIINITNNNDAFVAKYSTIGDYLWARSLQGVEAQIAETVAVMPDGNVVAAGYFINTIDLDASNNNDFRSSVGQRDAFIANYSSNGQYRWGKTIGGTGNDYAYKIATDHQRRVFLTGTFEGTMDINPDNNQNAFLNSADGSDIYYAQFDSVGTLEWGIRAGGNGGELAPGMAVNNFRQIYSAGWYQIDATFDNTTINAIGDRDIFISKIDASLISNTQTHLRDELSVRVVPNPFTSSFRLEGLPYDPTTLVVISDLQGRVMVAADYINNQPIALPNTLAAGIYMVQIYQQQKIVASLKVMK